MVPRMVMCALGLSAVLFVAPPVTSSADVEPPPGRVRLVGRAVADDGGPFPALGASLMWAAWAYRHDRDRLDANLRFLAEHRFDYIRALGIVGRQPYWAGREIDWRWPDYADVIAGLTDLAYDRYGLRVQWTIFADADQMIPDRDDRVRLVDQFVEMSRGREHKIMMFELANEAWQNGFEGAGGLALLRELGRHLRGRTDIPVALSASAGQDCESHLELYAGEVADVITEHFDRDVSGPDGHWRPIRKSWDLAGCPGLPPVASNNEPIGPESSVEQDDDPMRLVTAAIASYMGGLAMYVFHTDAGVWGRRHLREMANAEQTVRGYAAMKAYLPGDLANWTRYHHDSPGHPFMTYAGGQPNARWPEGHDDGAVQVLAASSGDRFLVLPLGIRNFLQLRATRAMSVEVIHPLTGEVVERRDLEAGEWLRLEGLPAFLLRGVRS
jgi:hypothetical protein